MREKERLKKTGVPKILQFQKVVHFLQNFLSISMPTKVFRNSPYTLKNTTAGSKIADIICQTRKYSIIFIYHQTSSRYQISLTKMSRSWTPLLIKLNLNYSLSEYYFLFSIRDQYSIVHINKTYKYTFRKKKKYSRVSRNSYIWFNHIQKIVYAPYAIFFFFQDSKHKLV